MDDTCSICRSSPENDGTSSDDCADDGHVGFSTVAQRSAVDVVESAGLSIRKDVTLCKKLEETQDLHILLSN